MLKDNITQALYTCLRLADRYLMKKNSVCVLFKDKEEQIIYVANTGELIDYHAVLSNNRYPDSAAALEERTIKSSDSVLRLTEVRGTMPAFL